MADDNPTKSILDECWEWKGSNVRGYGQKKIKGRSRLLHRVAWEWVNGPIPDGMLVCHTCDNPPCVNPKHLFLGDSTVNNRDCVAKGRHNLASQTHCKRGHPLSGTALRLRQRCGRTHRVCVTCVWVRNQKMIKARSEVRRLRRLERVSA